MSTVKNIFFMGSSTAIRLGCGMLTFIVMARLLGPEQFGVTMLWLSVATLVSMVANFGLTPYLLKEIGANPHNADEIMNQAFSIRLLLSALVISISLCGLVWVSSEQRIVCFVLLLAMLFDTITEFLNVGFRATNRFSAETRIAVITALLQFLVISTLLYLLDRTAIVAGIGFMFSRFVTTLLTWNSQRKYFRNLKPVKFKETIVCIRKTYAYAIDYCLQSLFGQIDSVILNHFVGPAAVGVYQAGMRIFMGAAQAAPVLANVFLPKASALATRDCKSAEFSIEVKRIQLAFVLLGAAFGFSMAVFNDVIVDFMFGVDFSDLKVLFPWLGFLFFLRFFASAWGMILTSAGMQLFRTVINAVQWGVSLSLVPFLVVNYGVIGWVITISIGQFILGVGYMIKGCTLVKPTKVLLFLSISSFFMFIPFLRLG